MKFTWFALFTALPLAAAAQASKDEVKKLAAAGVSEDVILTFVRARGGAPRMSADDLVDLKNAGVGDRVLAYMAGSTNAPAPAPERAVERTVYVQQPTYVYASTPYYGYGYDYGYDSYPAYYYRPYFYRPYYYRPYYSGWYGSPYYASGCGPRLGFSLGVGIGWGW